MRLCNLCQCGQRVSQLSRLIGVPVLLWCQTNTRAIGPATQIRSTIGRGRCPGGFDHGLCAETAGLNRCLYTSHIIISIAGRYRILPDQLFFWHFWTHIADLRTHITMQQLEPCPCKGICKLLWVLMIALRDSAVSRIFDHGHIRCGHHRGHGITRSVNFRGSVSIIQINRMPDMRASRALGQLPVIFE